MYLTAPFLLPQHPIRRTSRQERRTPRQERQALQQNTPRRLTQHPPPAANHPIATTPNVGAPFMTPIARQGETTGEPNTPATAHPTSTTYGQPPHRHHTKRRGAIYDARRPTGRNHRRTQHARDDTLKTPRLSVRPTSCRLRAATGVINGAPTTHRHQDNPAERNHKRTQHARGDTPKTPRQPMRPTSCRLRAAAGVINGAPTTHRHQEDPTGRNRRRT